MLPVMLPYDLFCRGTETRLRSPSLKMGHCTCNFPATTPFASDSGFSGIRENRTNGLNNLGTNCASENCYRQAVPG
jgi:hypothetical protein